jgi:hypothetical protein
VNDSVLYLKETHNKQISKVTIRKKGEKRGENRYTGIENIISMEK